MSTNKLITSKVPRPYEQRLLNDLAEFVNAQCSGHYLQHPNWFVHGKGSSTELFVTRAHDGGIVASSLVSLRGRGVKFLTKLSVDRGPIATTPETMLIHLEHLSIALRKRGHSLEISPYIFGESARQLESQLALQAFRKSQQSSHYLHSVIVQIADSVPEQWRQLRRSTRTSINRSLKAGVRVDFSSARHELHAFLMNYSTAAKTKQIPPMTPSSISAIADIEKGNSDIGPYVISAVHGQDTVGQIILMRNSQSLVYEWGWMKGEYKANNIPVMHGLLFEATNHCRRLGIKELDLGGYWIERGAEDPINNFKLGFSKSIRHYVCAHICVFSRPAYQFHSCLHKLRNLIPA